jgi:hypothetical protein
LGSSEGQAQLHSCNGLRLWNFYEPVRARGFKFSSSRSRRLSGKRGFGPFFWSLASYELGSKIQSVKNIGGVMAEETPEQKLARLETENKALREQMEQRKPGQLRLKVSEKGGLSVYGLGRFPVTLYKEQWIRLLDYAGEIKSFLQENDQQLKAKEQGR